MIFKESDNNKINYRARKKFKTFLYFQSYSNEV